MKKSDDMVKIELIEALMKQRRQMTMTYYKWLSTPREYFPGDLLYMREAHMIVEIGLGGIDNVGELGERLGVTQGAVSQQLGKLEKKGYLIRVQDTGDKRQYSVKLTKKGEKLYERHQEYDKKQYAQVSQFFQDFSPEELELIKRFDQMFEKMLS